MSNAGPENAPPIDTREFNRTVLPLANIGRPATVLMLMQGDAATSEVYRRPVQHAFSPLTPSDANAAKGLTQRLTAQDRELYQRALDIFPEAGGEFSKLVHQGAFDKLQAFAGKAALALTAERELTIPGTFAIHALASIFAFAGRPHDVRHGDDRTTYFLTQFASELAWQPPAQSLNNGPDPFAFVQAIDKRTQLIGQATAVGIPWLYVKFTTLANRLILRQQITKLIDTEPTAKIDDIGELRHRNNQLFEELRRLKRYSIKSATHTQDNTTWSIHDLSDIYEQIAQGIGPESTVRPDQWKPQMVLMAIEQRADSENESHLVRPYLDFTNEYRPNYETYGRHVWMDEQGELFADVHGGIPFQRLYDAAGKPGNYEALRQFLLQKYFDLTVPATLVTRVASQTKQLLNTENPDQGRQAGIIYRDLLLPRIQVLRSIRSPEELEALDAQEVRAMEFTEAATKRRLHSVEAHPVRLPPGFSPSPEALAQARQLGIVLKPGETLRKKHKRGDASLGEVAHHAKKKLRDPAEQENL